MDHITRKAYRIHMRTSIDRLGIKSPPTKAIRHKPGKLNNSKEPKSSRPQEHLHPKKAGLNVNIKDAGS